MCLWTAAGRRVLLSVVALVPTHPRAHPKQVRGAGTRWRVREAVRETRRRLRTRNRVAAGTKHRVGTRPLAGGGGAVAPAHRRGGDQPRPLTHARGKRGPRAAAASAAAGRAVPPPPPPRVAGGSRGGSQRGARSVAAAAAVAATTGGVGAVAAAVPRPVPDAAARSAVAVVPAAPPTPLSVLRLPRMGNVPTVQFILPRSLPLKPAVASGPCPTRARHGVLSAAAVRPRAAPDAMATVSDKPRRRWHGGSRRADPQPVSDPQPRSFSPPPPPRRAVAAPPARTARGRRRC